MSIRFMGEQEDPELEVWLNRGLRPYDATRPPTEAEQRLQNEPRPKAKPAPRTESAGVWGTTRDGGTARCVCSNCLFTIYCQPPETK
jgi:hypothetical protein